MERSYEYKGFTIEIYHDNDAEDPKNAVDMFGTFSCHHKKYNLSSKDDRFKGEPERLKKYLSIKTGAPLFLPIYMLDHSGIIIRTTPFNDPWDSGLIGYIYVHKAKICREYNISTIHKKTREKVMTILQSEVEMMNDYITGNVYGYMVKDPEGEHVDSCWGFYGDAEKSGILTQAECAVNDVIQSRIEENLNKIKYLETQLEMAFS